MSWFTTDGAQGVLSTLGLVGVLGCWGGTVVDGSLWLLLKTVHSSKEFILPGSESALRSSFTGIYWPVDYLLQILVLFFWEAADGSHPTSSAIGLYFLGQLLPILFVVYYDSFRSGNQGLPTVLNATIALLAHQCCGIGCTGAYFGLLYLGASPLAKASAPQQRQQASSIPVKSILALPFALAIGYVFPAYLMTLSAPDVVSWDFKQRAIALWNVYPLWVVSVQKLVEQLIPEDAIPQFLQAAPGSKSHMNALRVVNTFAALFSFGMHSAVIGFSLASTSFPNMLAEGLAGQFSPWDLFVPPIWRTSISTIGDATRGFLLWDQAAGYAIMIYLGLLQLQASARSIKADLRNDTTLGLVALLVVLTGPGTASLVLSWISDELTYENEAGSSLLISQLATSEKVAMNGHAGKPANGHAVAPNANGHAEK